MKPEEELKLVSNILDGFYPCSYGVLGKAGVVAMTCSNKATALKYAKLYTKRLPDSPYKAVRLFFREIK